MTMETRNPYVPIHRLPTELLVLIFHHVAGDQSYPSSKILHPLLGVCKRWNTVINQTPQLWTTITSWEPQRLCLETLEKSLSLPLNLELIQDPIIHDNEPALISFMDAAVKHIDRWSWIRIRAVWEEVIQAFTDLGPPRSLEELDVRFVRRGDPGRTVYHRWFGGGELPQLRRLSLDGLAIPWNSPLLSNLTTLSITCDYSTGPSAHEAASILMACPNIITARLRFRHADSSSAHLSDLSPIHLHHLQSLDLKLAPAAIRYVLSRIRIPACRHFAISNLIRLDAVDPITIFSPETEHLAPVISSLLATSCSKLEINMGWHLYDFGFVVGHVIRIECQPEDPMLASLSWLVDNVVIPNGREVEVAVENVHLPRYPAAADILARLPQGTTAVTREREINHWELVMP